MKAFLVVLAFSSVVVSQNLTVMNINTAKECATQPKQVFMYRNDACVANTTCSPLYNNTYHTDMRCSEVSKVKDYTTGVYGTTPWALLYAYGASSTCDSKSLAYIVANVADGSCVVTDSGTTSWQLTINSDKSLKIKKFSDLNCTNVTADDTLLAGNLNVCVPSPAGFFIISHSSLSVKSNAVVGLSVSLMVILFAFMAFFA
jgi:hypothetical protein